MYTTGTQVQDGLAMLEAITLLCDGLLVRHSTEGAITASVSIRMMEANCGSTIVSQSTMMACMVGAIGRQPNIIFMGGAL
jgi:hypothetical protein